MISQNEIRYFDALKKIASYQSANHLRRHSEGEYGLPFEEALEMAYENIIEEAKFATKGKHRPTQKSITADDKNQ